MKDSRLPRSPGALSSLPNCGLKSSPLGPTMIMFVSVTAESWLVSHVTVTPGLTQIR
jgi:hypothetical protein